MADNTLLNTPDDPKAAKAKLKADKKEYKKTLKEQRKAQKEKEREFADRTAEINGDDAGGLATLVITFLIILIWLAIMALLVKLDVGGFGSDILAPLIKDVPYLNLILPEGSVDNKKDTVTVEVATDESGEGASTGAITSLEEAMAYIRRLEQALQSEMELNSSYASTIEKLQAEVARLEPFEKQQKQFYEDRAKFFEDIVYGENAPDPETYVTYYEMIDPDTAAAIYEKLVKNQFDDAAIKAFATTYSGMKAKRAAAIFDEMVKENQITLVAKILAQMSVENRGDILAAMEEANAAKLTQLLEPTSLEQKSTKVTG
ncbi:MAG: hypothetical protein K6C96_04475 [Butyrivibrio sp.]|nr:hypothetical protein [Butyrivibrio sp.]